MRKQTAKTESKDNAHGATRRDQDRAERFQVLDEFGEAFRNVPAAEIEPEANRALARGRARVGTGQAGPDE